MREMHGVGDMRVRVVEENSTVKLSASSEHLSPQEARYIAAKLIRLAKRVEARTTASNDAGKGDGA